MSKKISGSTSTGFKYSLDEDDLDDMELLEVLADVNDGDVMKTPKLLEMMLGEEQKKNIYNHCRSKKGKVPTKALTNELNDIFKSASDSLKNSSFSQSVSEDMKTN